MPWLILTRYHSKHQYMSLTSFVNSTPEVRDRLNETFPNHGNRVDTPLQAPPQTTNYAHVGMAFDYLVRFWLDYHTDTPPTREWVADTGLKLVETHYAEYVDAAHEAMERAKGLYNDYLDSGELTRPLIEATFDLARLESVYRGRADGLDALGDYNDADILDCIQLYETLTNSDVFDGEEFKLNPTFGMGSHLVGGADADVIMDGTLIELKTTKDPTFKANYWRQLIGYCILVDIHNTLCDIDIDANDEPLPKIQEVGVYFARHGVLQSVDAATIYDHDAYESVKEWFVEMALSTYGEAVPQPYQDELNRQFVDTNGTANE